MPSFAVSATLIKCDRYFATMIETLQYYHMQMKQRCFPLSETIRSFQSRETNASGLSLKTSVRQQWCGRSLTKCLHFAQTMSRLLWHKASWFSTKFRCGNFCCEYGTPTIVKLHRYMRMPVIRTVANTIRNVVIASWEKWELVFTSESSLDIRYSICNPLSSLSQTQYFKKPVMSTHLFYRIGTSLNLIHQKIFIFSYRGV